MLIVLDNLFFQAWVFERNWIANDMQTYHAHAVWKLNEEERTKMSPSEARFRTLKSFALNPCRDSAADKNHLDGERWTRLLSDVDESPEYTNTWRRNVWTHRTREVWTVGFLMQLDIPPGKSVIKLLYSNIANNSIKLRWNQSVFIGPSKNFSKICPSLNRQIYNHEYCEWQSPKLEPLY